MPYFFCKKSASVNLKKVLTTCDSYCILLPVLNKAVRYARVAQLVEHDLAKVGVAGSSPVSRSFYLLRKALILLAFRRFFNSFS